MSPGSKGVGQGHPIRLFINMRTHPDLCWDFFFFLIIKMGRIFIEIFIRYYIVLHSKNIAGRKPGTSSIHQRTFSIS